MSIKPYEELTIQDNFIFQKVMRNKRICKQTLERLLDIDSLEKGQHYSKLNDTYIIFICIFEVFPDKFYKYTFQNLCLQNTNRVLNDGTYKIFLSTKGELDDISKPLKYFLDYIDGKEPEDALMYEIDSEVHTIKQCDEWRRDYMTLAFEMENKLKEGIEIGREEGKIETVIGMLKEKLSIEMISRITKLTVEQITEIGKMNALL